MNRKTTLAIVRVCGVVMFALATIALVGYALGVERFYRPTAGVGMAPTTAMCLLLAGFALFALASLNGNGNGKEQARTGEAPQSNAPRASRREEPEDGS